jgi:hypothetical protein
MFNWLVRLWQKFEGWALGRRTFLSLTVPRIFALVVAKNRDMREIPLLVPHADYGDQECCGIIMPVERGATWQIPELLSK